MRGIVLTVLALIALTEPTGDVVRVRVEAAAPGTGNPGRTAALEAAQREAILQVARSYTGLEDMRPFQKLVDRARTYVRSYQILSEQQQGGETRISLETLLAEKRLRHDIAATALPLFPRPPLVAVVLLQPPKRDDAGLSFTLTGASGRSLASFEADVAPAGSERRP